MTLINALLCLIIEKDILLINVNKKMSPNVVTSAAGRIF